MNELTRLPARRHRDAARGWLVGVAVALLQPATWPPARAHAVITEDSLARQPVQPGTPTQVQLQFNTGVEIKLSRVTLVSQGDTEQVVAISAGARRAKTSRHNARTTPLSANPTITMEITQ